MFLVYKFISSSFSCYIGLVECEIHLPSAYQDKTSLSQLTPGGDKILSVQGVLFF
jgi:hypothetical protein